MDENAEIDREELIAVLGQSELLAELGHTLTPKGAIALTLMQKLDLSIDAAETLAQEIDNTIFLAGWVYVQSDQLRIVD
jgi:hypothetical protein